MGSKRKKKAAVGRRLSDAICNEIARMAADHNRYFDSFIATWEEATKNTDNFAETYIQFHNASFTKDHIKALLSPYSAETMVVYSRLIYGMSNDEAALFSASVEDNLAAWQKLCAAIPLRRPHLAPVLDGILDDVRKTAKFVSDMFLGWIPAELTPAYGASFLAAKGALEKIWEEVGV